MKIDFYIGLWCMNLLKIQGIVMKNLLQLIY